MFPSSHAIKYEETPFVRDSEDSNPEILSVVKVFGSIQITDFRKIVSFLIFL